MKKQVLLINLKKLLTNKKNNVIINLTIKKERKKKMNRKQIVENYLTELGIIKYFEVEDNGNFISHRFQVGSLDIEQAETEEDIMNELEGIREFFNLPQVLDKQKTEQKLKELDEQIKKRNWRTYSELSKGE